MIQQGLFETRVLSLRQFTRMNRPARWCRKWWCRWWCSAVNMNPA